MLSESDIDIGRLSAGWDADTDFDALPPHLVDVTQEDVESADLFQGDGEPEEFEPNLEAFPVFKGALRHFQANVPRTRAVRIDTEKSYDEFGVDKALKELERRTLDLRAAVEAHTADAHGGKFEKLRQWEEVLGAVDAVADLKKSETAKEAIAKMPQVPLTVPEFAQGAVKCWQDGDSVVVSIRFALPDGSTRIATMGQKPRVKEAEIEQWAEAQGFDPLTILGALPAIASVATGKQLVRDTAQAALDACTRDDVCLMGTDDEPLVLIGLGQANAPIAAVMYLQQRAEQGDAQAVRELETMHAAAQTPAGQRIAAPVLAEASRRLASARKERSGGSFADNYARLAAFV